MSTYNTSGSSTGGAPSGSPYGTSGSPYGSSSSPYGSSPAAAPGSPSSSGPSSTSPSGAGPSAGSGPSGSSPYPSAPTSPVAVPYRDEAYLSFTSIAIAVIVMALNVYITPIFLSSTGDNPIASKSAIKTIHTFLSMPFYVQQTLFTSLCLLIAFLVCFLTCRYAPVFCDDVGRYVVSYVMMLLIAGCCVVFADSNRLAHPHIVYSLLCTLALAGSAYVTHVIEVDTSIGKRLLIWLLEIVLLGAALFVHQYNI